MSVSKTKSLLFSAALLVTLMISNSANAQTDFGLPELDPPPRYLVEACADHQVFYAAPALTGFLVVNDRGVEHGPYGSYEEAYEAGMEQWWILFAVEEVELPQTWFYWNTFDSRADASSECAGLESFGFDSKIKTIWSAKMDRESMQPIDMIRN